MRRLKVLGVHNINGVPRAAIQIGAIRALADTTGVTMAGCASPAGFGWLRYSLWVDGRTSTHVFGDRRRAFLRQIPLLAGMILFNVFSLRLLKQPMEIQTSAM